MWHKVKYGDYARSSKLGEFLVYREAPRRQSWGVDLDGISWPSTTPEPVRWRCKEDAMAAVDSEINK